MKIPWRGLKSESVQINLHDIFLIVTNCDDGDVTNIQKRVRFETSVFITIEGGTGLVCSVYQSFFLYTASCKAEAEMLKGKAS